MLIMAYNKDYKGYMLITKEEVIDISGRDEIDPNEQGSSQSVLI